jgi:DNA-directed RNA polymerase subunit beta
VLIKELQSLALDVRVLDTDGFEIDLKANFEDDEDIIPQPVSVAEDMEEMVEIGSLDDGFLEEGDDDDDYSDLDDSPMDLVYEQEDLV